MIIELKFILIARNSKIVLFGITTMAKSDFKFETSEYGFF